MQIEEEAREYTIKYQNDVYEKYNYIMHEYLKKYFNDIKDDIILIDRVFNNKRILYFSGKTGHWESFSLNDFSKLVMPSNIKLFRLCINKYKEEVTPFIPLFDKSDFTLDMKLNITKIKSSYIRANIQKSLETRYLSYKHHSNKYAFPVKNGVIDLKTGELRKGLREDYFTFKQDIQYEGLDKDTSFINNHISELMCGDKEMINKLQKTVGYFLSGCNDEGRRLIVFEGDTNTGKSCFFKLINFIMEYFIKHASFYDLGNVYDYLEFKRLCVIFEPEVPVNRSIVVFKKIIRDGYLFSNSHSGYSMYLNFKFLIVTDSIDNLIKENPCLNKDKKLLEKNMIKISFNKKFEGEEKKDYSNLCEILERHKEEFLVWAVKGVIKYFQDGNI